MLRDFFINFVFTNILGFVFFALCTFVYKFALSIKEELNVVNINSVDPILLLIAILVVSAIISYFKTTKEYSNK